MALTSRSFLDHASPASNTPFPVVFAHDVFHGVSTKTPQARRTTEIERLTFVVDYRRRVLGDFHSAHRVGGRSRDAISLLTGCSPYPVCSRGVFFSKESIEPSHGHLLRLAPRGRRVHEGAPRSSRPDRGDSRIEDTIRASSTHPGRPLHLHCIDDSPSVATAL
jgi:hypothetical protein